ncbi:MAG: Surfeit locus 1 family protein [Cereibacter sphaeroides]|uniref:SURF1-like protein n=1 Tax=Cereibacter sphaeroides TaxID=1063 RepID=A0A2W5UFD1_CERSP|nr:MAG: Surfeit locus 1 family protein [Cereibacter sphaeroides]
MTFRRILLSLCLLASFASLTALGVWQLERRVWKLDLIARVNTRLTAAATPTPGPADWHSISRENDEYRRVTVSGRFRHEQETAVQAVTELGGGYWILTPFETPSFTVLINRGFVPPDRLDPATRADGQPSGDVSIEGLLRLSEPGGGFLRSNDPQAGRWYSRDVTAIADAQGLGQVAPYFIDAGDAENPGGYPLGGLTVIQFRNSHLTYALIWFSLAAGLVIATVIAVRRG